MLISLVGLFSVKLSVIAFLQSLCSRKDLYLSALRYGSSQLICREGVFKL
ncbi:hypothetical protein M758_1G253000 [Ceratodon purpureus]|nr:hypothetical protein M758_1G253000 [Ceratodon purpureus]